MVSRCAMMMEQWRVTFVALWRNGSITAVKVYRLSVVTPRNRIL